MDINIRSGTIVPLGVNFAPLAQVGYLLHSSLGTGAARQLQTWIAASGLLEERRQPQLQARPVAEAPPVPVDMDPAAIESVRLRIAELKEIAAEEGIAWSPAAEEQLWTCLRLMPSPSRPALGIDSNGDVRALWENMLQEQVGLRFKGGATVEAVLFQRTQHGVRREVLSAEFPAILRLIKEMKLLHVTRG